LGFNLWIREKNLVLYPQKDRNYTFLPVLYRFRWNQREAYSSAVIEKKIFILTTKLIYIVKQLKIKEKNDDSCCIL
jgi:hypothetical protein